MGRNIFYVVAVLQTTAIEANTCNTSEFGIVINAKYYARDRLVYGGVGVGQIVYDRVEKFHRADIVFGRTTQGGKERAAMRCTGQARAQWICPQRSTFQIFFQQEVIAFGDRLCKHRIGPTTQEIYNCSIVVARISGAIDRHNPRRPLALYRL